jgi:sugar phosphate isomerase/epimerase
MERDRIVEADGRVWAWRSDANPLEEGFPPARAPGVLAWSGWIGEPDRPAELVQRNFRTWMPETWSRLEAALAEALPRYHREGARLLIRPHPRHAVSDGQSCARIAAWAGPGPLGLLIDLAGLLTASMLPAAEDHLERLAERLAPLEKVAGVLVCNAKPSQADPDVLLPCPLRDGGLDPRVVLRTAAAFRRARHVYLAGDGPEQGLSGT